VDNIHPVSEKINPYLIAIVLYLFEKTKFYDLFFIQRRAVPGK
jgi:hypothetical protein